MRFLNSVSRAIDTMNRWIGRATVWLILASILISAGNAVMRKAFSSSSNFWLEVQWELYGAAFLCAAGYVLLVDEHVRIDAIAQRFSPSLRAWLDMIVLLFFVLPLCALMVDAGGSFFWRSFQSGEGSFNAGGAQRWMVNLCIPVGFGLLGLQAVSESIKRAAFLLGQRIRSSQTEEDLPEFFGSAPAAKARS
jgi:TRAP-type mannitol/chloroaromatic compound transport system permease small subunit